MCSDIIQNESALVHPVINGCTSGFMDLDLLRKRAEKIFNGGMNDNSLEKT